MKPLNTTRIVFLGDSITDGNSYCGMVAQALANNGVAAHPINAGIGGDTAKGMLSRLDRDVFAYNPTLVTISAGTNDAGQSVPLADYASSVTGIVDALLDRDIDVVLLTAPTMSADYADREAGVVEYNTFMRSLGHEKGLPVADVYALMHRARESGEVLLEDDGIHPNKPGHDVIARAVLDALGGSDIAVPVDYVPSMLPGVVTQWHIRAADSADALTSADEAALEPDPSWATICVPQPGPASLWWLELERTRGFVVDLEKLIGDAPKYIGLGSVTSAAGRDAYLNTGAGLQAVWLNGEEVYRYTAHHGWHAGRDRITVRLKAGENRLVIEAGGQFFVSITDDNQW